jgi:hypothetical protein
MHVTVCDVGVTATKQPHCDFCLSSGSSRTMPRPLIVPRNKNKSTPQQQNGMMVGMAQGAWLVSRDGAAQLIL